MKLITTVLMTLLKKEKIDANEDFKSHTGEVIDENDEGFIGPKLPRLITEAEVEAFKAELFVKYKGHANY